MSDRTRGLFGGKRHDPMSNSALIGWIDGVWRVLANVICKAAFIHWFEVVGHDWVLTHSAVVMQNVLCKECSVVINRLDDVQQLTAFRTYPVVRSTVWSTPHIATRTLDAECFLLSCGHRVHPIRYAYRQSRNMTDKKPNELWVLKGMGVEPWSCIQPLGWNGKCTWEVGLYWL